MKTTLILIALSTSAIADVGEIRTEVLKAYAMDPIRVEAIAVQWNNICAHVVAGVGLHPLTPLVDYKDQSLVADDPTTKEIKQVKMMLNDLKPIYIMSAASKHMLTKPEPKKRDPLVRERIESPRPTRIITTPESSSR